MVRFVDEEDDHVPLARCSTSRGVDKTKGTTPPPSKRPRTGELPPRPQSQVGRSRPGITIRDPPATKEPRSVAQSAEPQRALKRLRKASDAALVEIVDEPREGDRSTRSSKGKEVMAERWVPEVNLRSDDSIGTRDTAVHLLTGMRLPAYISIAKDMGHRRLCEDLLQSLAKVNVQAVEAGARISSMSEELEGIRAESERKVKDLESELASTKDKRDKLKRLADERGDEVKALVSEKHMLKEELARQREEKEKFLKDAQSASSLCEQAMRDLDNMRQALKEERIDAIKRWKRRFLTAECKQYSCGLALAILRRCHKEHPLVGDQQIPLNEFAATRLPRALGLSFEELEEMANREEEEAIDEQLDASSDELTLEGTEVNAEEVSAREVGAERDALDVPNTPSDAPDQPLSLVPEEAPVDVIPQVEENISGLLPAPPVSHVDNVVEQVPEGH